MSLDRRRFLLTTAGLAASARAGFAAQLQAHRGSVLPASVRADFPLAAAETYLNSASIHPMSGPALRAIEQYLQFRHRGHGEGRSFFGVPEQQELKRRFAGLINAKPHEIAFVQNTSDGENIVVSGMDLPRRGGNVVIDDLHFTTSVYMYKSLEAKGLELRLVKNRNGAIDVDDLARAINGRTRLVSIALVSNVNGYLHDARVIADLAHARGAFLYADLIQAVGAIPVDVRAMGIDFAATATYKWLMGDFGFGYLYVREDLQDTVVRTTRYGHRQVTNFDRVGLTWEPLPGAARYETGTIANAQAAASWASLGYIEQLGIANIRAHSRQLTDRLKKELPAIGYRLLTPPHTETPIVAFEIRDVAATTAKLNEARIVATTIANEKRLRLSVSVFNTHDDIDRLIRVLAST
jgi:selenocysteine lyase/cysteine desulfurase